MRVATEVFWTEGEFLTHVSGVELGARVLEYCRAVVGKAWQICSCHVNVVDCDASGEVAVVKVRDEPVK